MDPIGILYPVTALVFWTMLMYLRLGLLRNRAVGNRDVSIKYFRSYQGSQPEQLEVASRHVINLLEMPVLFYLVCVLAYITLTVNSLILGLAWLYVGLRLVHSLIHLTSNNVLHRFRVFISSWLVLICIWLIWLGQLLMAAESGV